VRRLRDFFRAGATQLEQLSLVDLMNEAAAPFQELARREDILALPEKVWVDFRMNWAESRTNAGFHGF
jgi:hypothetical protein